MSDSKQETVDNAVKAQSRKERRRAAQGSASTASAASSGKASGRKAVRRRKQRRSWYKSPIAAGAIVVLLGVMTFVSTKAVGYARFRTMRNAVAKDTFYSGITVDGVDVSKMTLDQALHNWSSNDLSASEGITIDIEGHTYHITPEEIEYSDNYKTVLKSAYAVGRFGTLESRYGEVAKASGAWQRDYQITAAFNEETLRDRVNDIALELSQPAIETTITGFDADNSTFTFKEGQEGRIVDAEALYDAVVEKLNEGGGTVKMNLRTVQPAETVETLKGQFGRISVGRTPIRDDSPNRVNNLKVASSVLNGICIQPGETFSFNGTLGKRTKEKGYKAAGALENGVHTSQLGGGICQVASTMFNAIARADMQIIHREPHSIPSTYVALGRDATVSYPKQDFQWKNTSDYPIYLRVGVSMKKKQMIVEVYGKFLKDGMQIELDVTKNATYKPGKDVIKKTTSLPSGERRVVEKARKGYLCTTYRVYKDKDGKVLDRVELFKSYYAPAGALIEVGA